MTHLGMHFESGDTFGMHGKAWPTKYDEDEECDEFDQSLVPCEPGGGKDSNSAAAEVAHMSPGRTVAPPGGAEVASPGGAEVAHMVTPEGAPKAPTGGFLSGIRGPVSSKMVDDDEVPRIVTEAWRRREEQGNVKGKAAWHARGHAKGQEGEVRWLSGGPESSEEQRGEVWHVEGHAKGRSAGKAQGQQTEAWHVKGHAKGRAAGGETRQELQNKGTSGGKEGWRVKGKGLRDPNNPQYR